MGYKYMSFGGKLGSWFELDGFMGDYQELAKWYIEDTRQGGWIVSAHYHGIQHFRRIFGEVVSVCAFDSTSRGIAAATILLKHINGASSSIQWGMPIGGKWFNKLIVSGSRGSIEIDGAEYLFHTEKVKKTGNLKPINTFNADLKSLLDKLDGKEKFAVANQDMLINLKIALIAEQSAVQGKTLKVK
jgi:predicted dehydrogenase